MTEWRLQSDHSVELTPFQASFVSQVLGAEEGARIVLTAPPGTGKSTAVAALLASVQQEVGEAFRALVLAPRFLVEQWVVRFERSGVNRVQWVDAQQYRYLQASTGPRSNPWDRPGVFLATPDFLSRNHRIAEVTGLTWDVVVVEQLQHYSNVDSQRGALVNRLWGSPEVRKAIALADLEELSRFATERADTEHVQWSVPEVVAHLQERSAPTRGVELHRYELSTTEAELVRLVSARLETAEAAGNIERFYRRMLLSQLRSSINATELMLRRAARLSDPAAGDPSEVWEVELSSAEDVLTDSDDLGMIKTTWPSGALPFSASEYEHLFSLFEESGDSKWEICEQVLTSVPNSGQATVMFTRSASTASYLQALLELVEIPCRVITGNSPVASVPDAIADIRAGGGVLVCTEAASAGIDLGFMGRVVHYDLPGDRMRLLQRMGRVERWGREGESVRHHFFCDNVLTREEEVRGLLSNESETT
jgi:hypothetical protein